MCNNCNCKCDKKPQVDWTKPIQLEDGTLATLVLSGFRWPKGSYSSRCTHLIKYEINGCDNLLWADDTGAVTQVNKQVVNRPPPKSKIKLAVFKTKSMIPQTAVGARIEALDKNPSYKKLFETEIEYEVD